MNNNPSFPIILPSDEPNHDLFAVMNDFPNYSVIDLDNGTLTEKLLFSSVPSHFRTRDMSMGIYRRSYLVIKHYVVWFGCTGPTKV